ncbi:hypothetical protein CERSUDRAFT_114108 [Gelatoporia subvermispora B]|uniref:F-box domain-containing protein n=1 Tax=Ceriporiopsis subvermispora (strain B) TaxID=914234 RepID=M2RG96_CERS8|nr:hypothetical protein CERSUDRAFT_114108 [Gelatoporia subvermispora B]
MDWSQKIPPETTDRIIDHLHYDRPTLRHCALVCHAWLPASRFHLFYTVTVSGVRIFASEKLVESAPWVAYCVRDLKLTGTIIPQNKDPEAPLVPIVTKFTHLRSLHLYWTLQRFPSPSLLTHLSSITELVFVNVRFVNNCERLAKFIALFPYLQKLIIRTISSELPPREQMIGADELVAVLSRSSIRKLLVGGMHSTIASALCRASLPHLTHFARIRVYSKAPAEHAMYVALSPSLREVSLDVTGWTKPDIDDTDYMRLIEPCPTGLPTLRIIGLPSQLAVAARVFGDIVQPRFATTHLHLICPEAFSQSKDQIIQEIQDLANVLQADWTRTTRILVCFAGRIMDERQLGARTEGIAKQIFADLLKRGTVQLQFVSDLMEAIDRELVLEPNMPQ